MEKIQVILRGGSPLLKTGMIAALRQDPAIRLVDHSGEAGEAPASELAGDVLILITNSPSAAVNAILTEYPIRVPVGRVLILTECDQVDELRATVRLGVGGYGINNAVQPDELARAVRAIAHDRSWACPSTVRRLFEAVGEERTPAPPRWPRGIPISERELAVLTLAATGAREPEIAKKLYLSPNTVKTYLRRIRQKLQVATRAEAVQAAITLGLIAAPAERPSSIGPPWPQSAGVN